jgi:FkbH-like protein
MIEGATSARSSGQAPWKNLALHKDPQPALQALQHHLRRRAAGPEELDACGRALRKLPTDQAAITPGWHLRWAGQCTTAWLANCASAIAWREGILLRTTEAEFDNVLQDVTSFPGQVAPSSPLFYVFLPWLRPIENDADAEELQNRFTSDLRFWEQAWSHAQAAGARFIQIGFDLMHAGPAGYHAGTREGAWQLVYRLNDALKQRMPRNAYFVDLHLVAGELGRTSFYDPRRFFWTRQPFSEAGCVLLAEHVVAGVRTSLAGPKKVLVLDLDNTLWGGVVGETGPCHISLGETPEGEAYRQFQSYLKALARRGVILAVASKNNPADAREPFQVNPAMVLRLDDFACFEAGWEPKALSLSRIAAALNLGLDSFVFFDDSPAERDQICQALPQVTVVDVPPDPADFIRALEKGLWFETLIVTDEDKIRALSYRQESERQSMRGNSASLEEYLQSLEMAADVLPITAGELPRIVQLLAKTNQFNLTTLRHSEDDVRRILADPRSVGMAVKLSDRFGDYGLIAVVLAHPEGAHDADALYINTWLMSCRAIGRTVEHFTCRRLIEAAKGLGYRRIVGRYIPTNKNKVVDDLYSRLGFSRLPADDLCGERFELSLDRAPAWTTFVRAA